MPHTARAPTVFDPALLGWVGVERADGWVARSLRSVGAARQSSESAANSSAAWDDGEDEIEDLDVTPGSADADVVAGPEAPHDEEPEDTIADGAGDGDGGIHVYGWTEWPLRGVNSVKVGASSVPRFGTTPGIVEDVARLPVDVIRQPGAADLLIPFLMPVEPDEVLRLPLAEDILGSFDGTALGELLLEAARRGLKVSLTLGTLGAGAAGEFGEDPSEAVFRPIGLLWSRSHVGASLDGSVFCEGSTDSARRKFLDIRDRYQRRWLREYTRFACALLVDIEGDIRDELEDPTFVLERVVHCIEIFNEIDTCNVVRSSVRNSTFGEESWKSTAYWWARTCYSMARAVETELGGRIPAWLPGLASYDVDEALLDERTAGLDQNVEQYVHTWAWKINFYAEFARRFSILANRDGYTSRTVATIAGGVDYHWYHRKSADRSINAGGGSVSIVPTTTGGEAVWVSFFDQGSSVPQEMGIWKTLDHGGMWEYQAAGIPDGVVRDPDDETVYICKEEPYPSVYYANPLGSNGQEFNDTGDPTSDTVASWGNPRSITALDEDVAIVVFSSYTDGALSSDGRLALTLDGGGNWEEVTFDGGSATCDAATFFEHPKRAHLIRPGSPGYSQANDADSSGILDDGEWQIQVLLSSRYGPGGDCALARVTVSGATGALDAVWDWYTLDDTGACQVDGDNISGAVPSPGSDDAYLWGKYEHFRSSSGTYTPSQEHTGGACVIDLKDVTAPSTLTNLIDASTHRYNIADIAPHPTVTPDLLAVAPQLDAAAWFECMEVRDDGTASVGCPDVPEPLLLEWNGASWDESSVHADLPPSLVGTTIAWGEKETKLFYGTEGAGAWRTHATW